LGVRRQAMKKGELLSNMLVLMVNAHRGQFDKGGNPYQLHPIKVMHYLKTDDEELQCIALLHDVIEDTKTSYQDLRDIGCTERVINAVKALSPQWELECKKSETGEVVTNVTMPEFPGLEQILDTAQKLYDFVNNPCNKNKESG